MRSAAVRQGTPCADLWAGHTSVTIAPRPLPNLWPVQGPIDRPISRRRLLQSAGGVAAGAVLGGGLTLPRALAAGLALRGPDSLPDPSRPAGTADPSMPFDHVVIVMQENHSFDSYLGMLSRHGQPLADGFTFSPTGVPINANPYRGGWVTVQHAPSDCTLNGSGSQSWADTHRQIDGGRMDGFAATGVDSMAYWDHTDLPFYYSLAQTFCLANRWFCSAPCQTYPNRRFLQAGTASGIISTDTSNVTVNPANGTIWDRLHQHNISWADYFTEVPTAAIIFETVTKYPANMTPIARFYADCAAGTLPAVSMVDSGIGAVDVLASAINAQNPTLLPQGARPANIDQDEENGNLSEGENFVHNVIRAVLESPLWPRILLVWLYDEHGGNYDHVPPPAAIAPDAIPPMLGPGDPPGGYNMYGPRIPAVVVSGYSRPHAVTNVVHDHTSVLATIEAKWNLPALTFRDANAATLMDFLVPASAGPSFPEPPALAAPSNEVATQLACNPAPMTFPILSRDPQTQPALAHPRPAEPIRLRVLDARHRAGTVLIDVSAPAGDLHDVTIELEQHGRILARTHLDHLGHAGRRIALHLRPVAASERGKASRHTTGHRRHEGLRPGRYTIVVRSGHRTVLAHSEHLSAREL